MAEKKDACPICKSFSKNNDSPTKKGYYVICERCGEYSVAIVTLEDYKDEIRDNLAKLSYWIRANSEVNPVQLSPQLLIEVIKKTELPKLSEMVNNFIMWMGKNAITPEQRLSKNFNNLSAIIGTTNIQTVRFIINHLLERNIVNTALDSGSQYDGSLTYEGWELYDKLRKSVKDSTIAFMAMEYGNKELDILYNDSLKPAVDQTGYELRRLDENPEAGIIDNRMRVEIRKSRFLISDLSTDNRGAYWEAGFAEGLGKPVIFICEKDKFKNMHFDTNHSLTIPWDMEHLEEFKESLKNAIRATLPGEAKMED